MNNIKKTLSLVQSELKGSTGGELVIVLMLTVMMVCANIMSAAISEYAGTLIYLMSPNAQNAVKIISRDLYGDFGELKDSPDLEFGIEVRCYNENIGSLYAVSEELLDEKLSFMSKSNTDALKNSDVGDAVPLLISKSANLNIGNKGTLSDGTKYEVVGIIDNDDVQYFLFFVLNFNKFAIALDNGQFTSLTPVQNPIMFSQLAKGTDKEELVKNISSDGFSVSSFDPLNTIAPEFSSAITLSVVGTTAFTISVFGVIINCYLVFGSRRKYYRTIMTVGGKKKILLQCGAVIKTFQFLISFAVSVTSLILFNKLAEKSFFNTLSMIISSVLGILLIALSWLLLNRWLKKLSCIEN